MAFDISALKLEPTTEMHLKHPVTMEPLYDTDKDGNEDESKPVLFHLLGKASKQHKKAVEALMLKKKNRKGREPTLTESLADNVEFLASLSTKVDNMEVNGEAIESQEAFRSLYSDPSYSWVVDQVADSIGSVEDFLAK